MIVQEIKTINNRNYIHTYSNIDKYIIRNDGVEFVEAYDPMDTKYTYTESDKDLPKEESDKDLPKEESGENTESEVD